jgi:hypothetical protein
MEVTPEMAELAQRSIALAFLETRHSDNLMDRVQQTAEYLLASRDVMELISKCLADTTASDASRILQCMAIAFIAGGSWGVQMQKLAGKATNETNHH